MELLADVISWVCLLVGGAFALIGGIGVLRLPDVFTRMHGASIIDTLGLGLILIGLMFQTDDWLVTVKLNGIIPRRLANRMNMNTKLEEMLAMGPNMPSSP